MASGGPTDSSDRSSLTCSVCMDIYLDPKFLPCHHTFCSGCIQDRAGQYQGRTTFPCPICRKKTSLPPGGAAALQTNMYISADDLDRARRGQLCLVHFQKELDMFCIRCDQAICTTCLLTDHKSHQIQDLTEAIEVKKKEMTKDRQCANDAIAKLAQRIEAVKREQQNLQDQKMEVETAIHARHATVITSADKVRGEKLTTLQALSARLENGLAADLDCLQENLEEVKHLDQRLEQTVHSETGCELLTVAKELKDGRVNQKAVELLTAVKKRSEVRLESSLSSDPNIIRLQMRDFFGTVSMIGTKIIKLEGTVMVRFRCGEEKDTEVYSLFPLSNCHVVVSYARHGQREDAPCEQFDEQGKLVVTAEKVTGRVSWKEYGNARVMSPACQAGWFRTYNKSQTQTHLRLSNNFSGQADICRVKVTSKDPLETEHTYEFSIKVGAHCAHDVDASEQLLAVVEEGQVPDLQRKVRMFRRPQKDAVATYSPTTPTFHPSDVCFYTLGGQQVLLVADELGDSIHVVNVQGSTMTFVRYLVSNCPLLMQPTALNVDHKGRVWVACRGGNILTVEPGILHEHVFDICVCLCVVFGFLASCWWV